MSISSGKVTPVWGGRREGSWEFGGESVAMVVVWVGGGGELAEGNMVEEVEEVGEWVGSWAEGGLWVVVVVVGGGSGGWLVDGGRRETEEREGGGFTGHASYGWDLWRLGW